MATDEELMLRVARGDMDAFEELIERHQRSALSTARRFLGRSDAAEDLVQEAFLRILSRARHYRPTAAFRTYLFNVIYHLCVDTYRRCRAAPLDEPEQVADDGAGPGEAAQLRERAEAVQAAVAALPARQRMALVLKHFENMSYDDIARALDCSPRAVDSLLIRAKRALRESLGGLL